jgi:hypothetical protein
MRGLDPRTDGPPPAEAPMSAKETAATRYLNEGPFILIAYLII